MRSGNATDAVWNYKCVQALDRVELLIFWTEMSAVQVEAKGLINTNAIRQI